MSKKFLVNINMGGNQIVSPILNSAIIYGTSSDPGTGSSGQLFYNTTSNVIKYWNGTSWTPLATGGTTVSSLNSFNGSVTIAGTDNQIAVSNSTNTITLSLPASVVLKAATTAGASLNIPAATAAPSAPNVGDIWTTASTGTNILYYNGATKTVAFTDSNITGSAGSVANALSAGTGLSYSSGSTFDGSAARTLNLANTAVTAGSYGSSTSIPTFTVDAQGRLTAAGTASISTSISLAGTTGTGTVSGGGTLTFANGGGVASSVSGSTVTLSVDSTVLKTTASQNISNKTFQGNIYFQSAGGAGGSNNYIAVDNSTGALSVTSGYPLNLNATGNITLTASGGVVQVGSDTVATLTASQTLTNKTLTLPTIQSGGAVFAGSTSGNITLKATATAGTNTITLPAATGTVITTGDSATVTNTMLANSTISGISLGSNLAGLTIGTGLSGTSYNGSTGVTIANTGVLSITGTSNQVIASGSTGAITLSLPQSIATTSSPTFSMITISGTTTNATDVATKAYVDSLKSGFNLHTASEAASTTDLTTLGTWGTVTYANGTSGVGATLTPANNGTFVLDNYTPDQYDRVLIKNQTTATQNGIYIVTATGSGSSKWTLTRASDYDNSVAGEIQPGDLVYIAVNPSEYTITPVNNNTSWVMNNQGTGTNQSIVIGTDSITFVQFSGPGTVTGGTGITISGNTVSITAINPTSTTDTSTKGIVSGLTVNTQGQVTAQTTTTLGTEFTNASGTINITTGGISDSKLATITSSGKVANSATTATSSNTASTIVARDGSGNFTAGTITAALSGNASTATTLATPRAINGVNFDGSAAITIKASTTNALTIGTGLALSSGTTFDGSAAVTLSLSGIYTQKFAVTFTGGTSSNPFTVNHNLGTRDVTVQVYDNTSYDTVEVDVVRTDTNNVTVTFATTPTSGSNYRVVVIG